MSGLNLPRITFFLGIVLLAACEQGSTDVQAKNHQVIDKKLLKQFEKWKAQQNKKQIAKYQQFLAKNLKQPPSLFELSYNKHIKDETCVKYRFALAPESQWKNIIKPLQLLESLKEKKLIANYRVVSVYRGQEANECSKGAKASKHLKNYAVDFNIFDEKWKPYTEGNFKVQKLLCHYWRKEGKKQNLGFGTYTNNRYHFDVQGYRTWGYNYKGNTSACLSS